MTWKEDWKDFKKELTWNNIKVLISGGLPLVGFFYLYTQWINLVSPILNEYAKITDQVTGAASSQHNLILYLCLVAGFVGPLFLSFPILLFGTWLGKVTKFYRDDKTRYLWWDDKYYFVRDMPEEKRKQIEDILSNYKSKTQLRKERFANESWLKRNFS